MKTGKKTDYKELTSTLSYLLFGIERRCLVKVGRMRYRIEVEDLIKITDRDGFVSEEWIPFAEVSG